MKTFLRWLLFVSLMVVGLVLATQQGIVGEIWASDDYYISTAIFPLFIYATASCGYLAVRLSTLEIDLEKTANGVHR